MPALKLDFDNWRRPLVHVEVRPDLAQQQQFKLRPPCIVPAFTERFLVDTGSQGCVISEDLISAWHLPKVMPVIVKQHGKPKVHSYQYPLSLRLHMPGQSNAWAHSQCPVSTASPSQFDGMEFKGIIGMDILALGWISYSGPNGIFELSW